MKYNLKEILAEIKEDETHVVASRKKQISQKEIQAMVEKRRKKVGSKS
ncbi:MAG: hypothetical protein H7832_10260 [Magnetococcus sp. DMHC-6]